MATLGLGPVVGNIGGGADVKKIPVDIAADGDWYSVVVIHTVHVPVGETWLVALTGDLNPRYTDDRAPELSIGEASIGPHLRAGYHGLVAEVTGTAEITLKSNTNYRNVDYFVGHIYTVPLPN